MTEAKDILRSDLAPLLAALREAGADTRRPSAIKCPFHEDDSPSANVYKADDRAWRFKCHSASCGFCGDVFDVRAKVSGRSVDEELADVRDKPAEKNKAKPARTFPTVEAFEKAHDHRTETYRYTNPDTGKIELLKLRIEPPGERKRFVQAHINAAGHIVESAPPDPKPIYNRSRIRAATEAVVVEGEKCVHALARANVVATCCSGGGGKGAAAHADWSPLKGLTVFLWPDHDPADADGVRGGHEHMREVAEILKGLDCRLFWINPDKIGMNDKEDAADYLARFDPEAYGDAISDVLDVAIPIGASSELRQFLQDAIDGNRYAVPMPFKALSNLSKALQPGCVLVICGEPGTTKSFFVTQCVPFWIGQGFKPAIYMLEDDRRFHLCRVLAQVSGNSNITDPTWVREHADEAMAAEAEYRQLIDDVGRCMYDAPDDVPTYPQLLAWMQQVTQGGAKIVVIDPITSADSGKEPWRTDKEFMAKAKSILRRAGATMILVTHPKGGTSDKGAPRLDQMAGGQAFPRFSQTTFWIRRYSDERKRCVRTDLGNSYEFVNRFIHIVKGRNGKGQGSKICYFFDPNTLRFSELGLDGGEKKEPEVVDVG